MYAEFYGHGTEGEIRKGCVWETSIKKALKMQSCFLKLDGARGIFLNVLGMQHVNEWNVLWKEPEPVEKMNFMQTNVVC